MGQERRLDGREKLPPNEYEKLPPIKNSMAV
jgi:hypothetical protein